MFDKMSKETVRIRGDTKGKMDIIRNMNDIPDRQYLNDLFKVNKQLNQKNIRPAFSSASDGVVLNNELPVDTGTLRQSVQHQQGPNVLEQVTQPIPSSHNPDNAPLKYDTSTTKSARLLYANLEEGHGTLTDVASLGSDEKHKTLDKLLKFGVIVLESGAMVQFRKYGETFLNNIADGHNFEDVILSMANNFSEELFNLVLNLTKTFFDLFLQEINSALKIYISTESVLYRIMKQILQNYANMAFEQIRLHDMDILLAVKTYYLSLVTQSDTDQLLRCKDCNGFYFMCTL